MKAHLIGAVLAAFLFGLAAAQAVRAQGGIYSFVGTVNACDSCAEGEFELSTYIHLTVLRGQPIERWLTLRSGQTVRVTIEAMEPRSLEPTR